MRTAPLERAIGARWIRRSLSWVALCALLALGSTMSPQFQTVGVTEGVVAQPDTIRADIIEDFIDFIDDLLGGEDPPAEDPEQW